MATYRVLCLHGYRQNAEALRGRMSALRRALKSSMEFGAVVVVAAGTFRVCIDGVWSCLAESQSSWTVRSLSSPLTGTTPSLTSIA